MGNAEKKKKKRPTETRREEERSKKKRKSLGPGEEGEARTTDGGWEPPLVPITVASSNWAGSWLRVALGEGGGGALRGPLSRMEEIPASPAERIGERGRAEGGRPRRILVRGEAGTTTTL